MKPLSSFTGSVRNWLFTDQAAMEMVLTLERVVDKVRDFFFMLECFGPYVFSMQIVPNLQVIFGMLLFEMCCFHMCIAQKEVWSTFFPRSPGGVNACQHGLENFFFPHLPV